MDLTLAGFILSALAIMLSVFVLIRTNTNKIQASSSGGYDATALRLQAYERLVLLTERISLTNLVSRLNQQGIPAIEMKILLTESIKQEFDYNSTQQLYVSSACWDALRNLKEQNIMIINKVTSSLPPEASSSDLNKKILELVLNEPGASMHESVLKSLTFEAKKLMG